MAGNFSTTLTTTNPTLILSQNSSRTQVVICNNSTRDKVYVGLSSTLTVDEGIVLNPGGDTLTLNTSNSIYAVTVVTGTKITGSWS